LPEPEDRRGVGQCRRRDVGVPEPPEVKGSSCATFATGAVTEAPPTTAFSSRSAIPGDRPRRRAAAARPRWLCRDHSRFDGDANTRRLCPGMCATRYFARRSPPPDGLHAALEPRSSWQRKRMPRRCGRPSGAASARAGGSEGNQMSMDWESCGVSRRRRGGQLTHAGKPSPEPIGVSAPDQRPRREPQRSACSTAMPAA